MIWSLLVPVTVTELSQRQDNRLAQDRSEDFFAILPLIPRDCALRRSREHCRGSPFPFRFSITWKNIHELCVETDDMFRTSASLLKGIKQNKVSDVKSALTLQFDRLRLLSYKAYAYRLRLFCYPSRPQLERLKYLRRKRFLKEPPGKTLEYYDIGGPYEPVNIRGEMGVFMVVTFTDYFEKFRRCISEMQERYEHLLEFIAYWKDKLGLV